MSNSPTDIANLALTFLGEKPINNIEDIDDPNSQHIRRWLDVCVKEAQTTILWDELYTYNKPSFVTDSYAGVDGQFQYILPTNFLAVIEVNSIPPNSLPTSTDTRFAIDFNWKLQDGYLIARIDNFEMFYARYEPSPAKWSTQLKEFIYHYLAAKIAYTITDNAEVVQFAEVKFMEVKQRILCEKGNRSRRSMKRPTSFSISRAKRSISPRRI